MPRDRLGANARIMTAGHGEMINDLNM